MATTVILPIKFARFLCFLSLLIVINILPTVTNAQGRPDFVWMRGASSDVQSVAYSANGEWIASSDGTIKLWRVSDKMLVRTVGSGAFVAFSSDSKTLSGAGGNTICFWHLPDAVLVRIITVSANIISYALSADGLHFAVGLDNHQVQIWRIADSQLLYTLQGHTQAVQSLSFTGNGQLLASGGAAGDDHVRIWRVSDGSSVQTLDCPASGHGYQVAFAPNGTSLVVALIGENSFQIWRAADWTLASWIGAGPYIDGIAVSPDSSVVGVASHSCGQTGACGSTGRIYRLSDGTRLVERGLSGLWITAKPVVFSSDNTRLIYCEADTPDFGNAITFWRASDLNFEGELSSPGASGYVNSMAVSSDGQILASSVANHGAVNLRRTSDGALITSLPNGQPTGIAISPDGKLAATSYGYRTFAVWRISDGTLLRVFDLNSWQTDGVAFSPDGALVAGSSQAGITIWRVSDGTLVKTLADYGKVAFTPNGQTLVIGGNGASLYHVSDWTKFQTLPAGNVSTIALSSDSKMLACGTTDGLANVWDIASGAKIHEFQSNIGIRGVALSPDNQVLAVGGEDATLRLWLLSTDHLLATYNNETGSPGAYFGGVRGVFYSPDGKFLYYGRNDGTVCSILNPFHNTLFPNHGGNTGNVTVKIITAPDFPLNTGTDVKFTANGLPDIVPASTHIDSAYVMTATFPLNGAPLGKRNVVITLPNGETRTYPQGFTIEQGVLPQLSIEYIGNSTLRGGRERTFNILVSNKGNTDVRRATVWCALPKFINFRLSSDIQVRSTFVSEEGTVLLIDVPTISASSVTPIPIQLTALDTPQYAHASFSLFATVLPPLADEFSYANLDNHGLRISSSGDTFPIILPLQACCPECQADFNRLLGYGELYAFSLQSEAYAFGAYLAKTAQVAAKIHLAFDTALAIGIAGELLAASIGAGSLSAGELALFSAINTALISTTYELLRSIWHEPDFSTIGSLVNSNVINAGQLLANINTWAYRYRNELTIQQQNYTANYLEKIGYFLTLASAIYDVYNQDKDDLVRLWNEFLAADHFSTGARDNAVTALHNYWLCCAGCGQSNPPPTNGGIEGEGGSGILTGSIITSGDPNELRGPMGIGQLQWTASSQSLSYNVLFENLPTATAPAADIIVTDNLDAAKLDMTTLKLETITFADKTVTPTLDLSLPVGQRQFNADVDLRPTKNLIVRINANVDMLTGVLSWYFTSLDPVTMQPTDDPLAGFLEPGQEGSVLFSVQPKLNLPTGTVVANKATIVFDANAPMDTNVWSNTIDADKPLSRAKASIKGATARIKVTWAASDVGSGVHDGSIYVSDNGGPYLAWLANITDTELEFLGESGHSYSFKSRSRDNTYNLEDDHSRADATVKVQANATVSGVITLQGCLNPAQPMTLEFRPLNGGNNITRTVTLGSSGAFQVTVPAKRYQLAVKGRKWLRNVADVDARLPVSDVVVSLLAGDANNDNSVDIYDLTLLLGAYNTKNGDARWNPVADVNSDERVNYNDLLLLIQNYNVHGNP